MDRRGFLKLLGGVAAAEVAKPVIYVFAPPAGWTLNQDTEDDLLLNWQEMLIRMVANAFDMNAMALGVEHDISAGG